MPERLVEALLTALKSGLSFEPKGTGLKARKGRHGYYLKPTEGINPASTLILACGA